MILRKSGKTFHFARHKYRRIKNDPFPSQAKGWGTSGGTSFPFHSSPSVRPADDAVRRRAPGPTAVRSPPVGMISPRGSHSLRWGLRLFALKQGLRTVLKSGRCRHILLCAKHLCFPKLNSFLFKHAHHAPFRGIPTSCFPPPPPGPPFDPTESPSVFFFSNPAPPVHRLAVGQGSGCGLGLSFRADA